MITNNLDQLDPALLGPQRTRSIEVIQAKEKKLNIDLLAYSESMSGSSRSKADGPLTIISHLIRSRNFQKTLKMIPSDGHGTTSRCILFFPTNGVGLGHLTRLYAIARKMKALDPDLKIVFLSSVPILDQLTRDGIIFHHFPGKAKVTNGPTNVWNIFLKPIRRYRQTRRRE